MPAGHRCSVMTSMPAQAPYAEQATRRSVLSACHRQGGLGSRQRGRDMRRLDGVAMRNKDAAIRELITALPLQERGWCVVDPDPWEADLCAVGIARADHPRHLVYVCSFRMAPGGFYYECETPTGPHDTDYEVAEEGGATSLDQLMAVLSRHLSAPGA